MQRDVDWRHLVIAGVVVGLLIVAGWRMLTAPSPRPTAPAPAGSNPRMQDAPETLPAPGVGR
jgi:hypothetical protein